MPSLPRQNSPLTNAYLYMQAEIRAAELPKSRSPSTSRAPSRRASRTSLAQAGAELSLPDVDALGLSKSFALPTPPATPPLPPQKDTRRRTSVRFAEEVQIDRAHSSPPSPVHGRTVPASATATSFALAHPPLSMHGDETHRYRKRSVSQSELSSYGEVERASLARKILRPGTLTLCEFSMLLLRY